MDEGLPPLDPTGSYGIAPLVDTGGMSREEYAAWLEANLWRPSRVPGLGVPLDTSPAEWIAEGITPRVFEVRMMVPQGFEQRTSTRSTLRDG